MKVDLVEKEFISLIDADFPYDRPRIAAALVRLGCCISSNAAFMVLHEICRPPRSKRPPKASLLSDLLTLWAQNFEHPLKPLLLPVAEALILRTDISVERAIELMYKIEPFQGQYVALSIPYFACDDSEDRIDKVFEEITSRWKSQAQSANPT